MDIYKRFHDLWESISGRPHGIGMCKQATSVHQSLKINFVVISFRNQLRIKNKLGSRVKLRAFDCSKFPYTGRHAIEIVNIHFIVVEFGAVQIYIFVMANIHF